MSTNNEETQGAIDKSILDFSILRAWMDEQGLEAGPIENPELLAGGTQNILIRFQSGRKTYVLRRPPKHLRSASNEVLRRESRVLSALRDTNVPHPRFIAGCKDESVMGVVFYLMENVDGFNPAGGLLPYHLGSSDVRREMGFEAVDAISALGNVDHVKVGLSDFGKPEGFLERQVNRWMKELEGYSDLDGYLGPDIGGLDEVAGWLSENVPKNWKPGIMHGDFHLANVLYERESSKLAAIVDWEMSTIGDPLVDLGWLIATFPGKDALAVGPSMALANIDGFPTTDELTERYAQNSERSLTSIDWYTVLACFKLGIILEGTHARACAGKAEKSVGDLLHDITVALFKKALKVSGMG